MKSFQTIYTALQKRSHNAATAQLTQFKEDINTTQHLILSQMPGKFLEKTTDITTAASTNNYELPIDCKNNQVMAVEMRVSSTTIYRPKIVESASFWESLLSRAVSESDVTQYVYIYGGKIYIWPTVASASLTLRIRHRKIVPDMSADDYATGKILTATNGDETIAGGAAGDAPTWTSGMAGRYLRITKGAAASLGDGFWYEISSVTGAAALELVKKYAGSSIAAGAAAYTIGEMPVIPEPYQDLLIYRPLAIYFMNNEEEMTRADRLWKMYDGGYELGLSPIMGGLLGAMLNAYAGAGEGVFLDALPAAEPSLSDLSVKNYNYSGEGW